MTIIEQMLSGEIEMPEFISCLSDASVQEDLRALIPEEAKGNREHPLWKYYAYSALHATGFDLFAHVKKMYRFDASLSDNLNIWGTIEAFYRYHHPDFSFTTVYRDRFYLYLDSVRDCFDGPEVRDCIEKIINQALTLKTKTAQRAYAKEEIKKAFHVTDKKRPRWVQGPEWPMGANSPMQFLWQKRRGELTEYWFEDVDTQEKRLVEQFY